MAFGDSLDAKRAFWTSALLGMNSHSIPARRFLDFCNDRPNGANHPQADGTSFTFLGFSHIWGRSWAGRDMVRQITAKSRYAHALAAITAWCRRKRHRSVPDQQAHLTSMMPSHYA
jgi:hypothetical protein